MASGAEREHYWTEVFQAGDNDLTGITLTFTPDGSTNHYRMCVTPGGEFSFYDPIEMSLGDDASQAVNLTGGKQFVFFGVTNTTVYVGSNGYITFGGGDDTYLPSVTNHFSQPRISALFTDLDPSSGGYVMHDQMPDRLAITWYGVPEYDEGGENHAQIELFFNGVIRITYLRRDAPGGIAGLSDGTLPTNFVEDDLSAWPAPCGPANMVTVPSSVMEGSGILTNAGQVAIPTATNIAVQVYLVCSDTAQRRLQVPASVLITPGETSTNFDITVIETSAAEGTETFTIFVTNSMYLAGQAVIRVKDNDAIHLEIPETLFESAGTLANAGIVWLDIARTNDTQVALTSGNTNALVLPLTVSIPAGALTGRFDVATIEVPGPNGPRIVAVTANDGQRPDNRTVTVLDAMDGGLQLVLPTATTEGSGVLTNQGVVSVGANVSADVTITLISSDLSELRVPPSVVITQGASSATFDLTVVNDHWIDGPQTATVTARVFGWTNATASITVADNETKQLYLSTPASACENNGMLGRAGVVSLDGRWPSNTVVQLTSSNPDKLIVPPTVIIRAGKTNAFFNITIVNNTVVDGPQPVTITATATGFIETNSITIVMDDDVDHFEWSVITNLQEATVPIRATVVARGFSNAVVTCYQDNLTLTGVGDVWVTQFTTTNVAPTNVIVIVNGTWTGDIVVDTVDSNVVLRVESGIGVHGETNPFHSMPATVQYIHLNTGDLIYEPETDRIRASLPTGTRTNVIRTVSTALGPRQFLDWSDQLASNVIVEVRTWDGVITGPSVEVGPSPGKLLHSQDGQFLYVALDGSNAVSRRDRSTLAPNLMIPVGRSVHDMEELPGCTNALAVARSNGSVAVFDDAVGRPTVTPALNAVIYGSPISLAFGADSNLLYAAYKGVSSPGTLTPIRIDGAGATTNSPIYGVVDARGPIQYDAGLLYDNSGAVVSTNYITESLYQSMGIVCVDRSAGRVFYLGSGDFNSSGWLSVFEIDSRAYLGSVTMPNFQGHTASPTRCGSNRLAFRSSDGHVVIVRTPLIPTDQPADLVLSHSATPNPVPAGADFTYTVALTNRGPNHATAVTVLERLPPGLSVVSQNASEGTVTQTTECVVWQINQLADGGAAMLNLTVRPAQPGLYIASANVFANSVDPVTTNNLVMCAVRTGYSTAVDVVNDSRFGYNLNWAKETELAYSKSNGQIYVSVPVALNRPQLDLGVAPLDPESGALGIPVHVAGRPLNLSVSDNGEFLYTLTGVSVGSSYWNLSGVHRSNLSSRKTDEHLVFGLTGGGDLITASAIEAVPGMPGSVAVSHSRGVAIFDGSMQRPNVAFDWSCPIGPIEFGPTNNVLYGYGWDISNSRSLLGTLSVDANGTAFNGVLTNMIPYMYQADIRQAGGLVYSTTGVTIDPVQGAVVRTFPASGRVLPLPNKGRVLFLSGNTVQAFEPNTCAFLGSFTISTLAGNATDFIDWGTNGLAFATDQGQVGIWRSSLFGAGAAADVALTASAFPNPASGGSNVVYTITTRNNGPNPAARVRLYDRLPAGVVFVSASSSQGTCVQSNGLLVCDLGAVAAAGQATTTITVMPPVEMVMTNIMAAALDSFDPVHTNNTVTIYTSVIGAPMLEVSPTTNLYFTGVVGGPFQPASQTYVLTNSGTGQLTWSSSLSEWITLSATNGALNRGARSSVTASVNSVANSLPAGDYNGSVTFTNLTNGRGTVTRTIVLSVRPQPIALPQTVTTDEDTPVMIQLEGSDPDGRPLTAVVTGLPLKGSLYQTLDGANPSTAITNVPAVVTNALRRVIYAPPTNASGANLGDFLFRVQHTVGSSSNATVTVNVLPVNDAPVAVADTIRFIAGIRRVSFNVLTNDWDVDGDALTKDTHTLPARGQLAHLGNGNFVYVPSLAFTNGTDQFSYTISDGHGGSATGQVTLLPLARYLDGIDWPMFGGRPGHTGYYPGFLGSNTFTASWSTNFSGTILGVHEVAVASNRVYLTPHSQDSAPYIVALQTETGQQLWKRNLASSWSISPPTYANERVYAQRINGGDTQLWQLDAATGATNYASSFNAQWNRYMGPVVADGGIWMGGGTYGGIYGFNTNGTQRFYFRLPQKDNWAPAYAESNVFTWVNSTLNAFDPLTGSNRWSLVLPGSAGLPTTPCVENGVIYLQASSYLHAVDLQTRSNTWSVAGAFQGTPSIAQGIVYGMTSAGVKAYNATNGALLATYPMSDALPLFFSCQAIVLDDALIVPTYNNKTYVFNRSTAQLLQTIPAQGRLSVANGRLYIAGVDGTLRSYLVTDNSADLAVSITSSDGAAIGGSNLVYTVQVTNRSSRASTDVALTDDLPAAVTRLSVVPSQGTWTQVSQSVTCEFGTIPANATATAVIAVRPLAAGVIVNTATVQAMTPDFALANNSATSTVTIPVDHDNDGLPDAWEMAHFNSTNHPQGSPSADPDGDGFTNLQEWIAGTNPLDPHSTVRILAIERTASNYVVVTWQTSGGDAMFSTGGKTNVIEWTDDLRAGFTNTLATFYLPCCGDVVTNLTDNTVEGVKARFYRVRVLP